MFDASTWIGCGRRLVEAATNTPSTAKWKTESTMLSPFGRLLNITDRDLRNFSFFVVLIWLFCGPLARTTYLLAGSRAACWRVSVVRARRLLFVVMFWIRSVIWLGHPLYLEKPPRPRSRVCSHMFGDVCRSASDRSRWFDCSSSIAGVENNMRCWCLSAYIWYRSMTTLFSSHRTDVPQVVLARYHPVLRLHGVRIIEFISTEAQSTLGGDSRRDDDDSTAQGAETSNRNWTKAFYMRVSEHLSSRMCS